MTMSASPESRMPLLVSFVAGWVSVVLCLLPGKGVLPAEIASVTSFFLAQALLPRCRMTRSPLVTPLNWMQFAFFIQLVVMPVTVRIWGYAQRQFLPHPPTALADNIALLLVTLAYWAFCAAVQFRNVESVRSNPQRWPLPTFVICLFAALGIIGIAARYKTPTIFIHAMTDPASYALETDRNGASASIMDAVGDFFSSFLGTSIVMLWCRRLDRRLRAGEAGQFGDALLLVLAALAFAITGYNRANIVFPLVAVSAVLTIRGARHAVRNLLVVGSLIVSLVTATAIYRFSAHPENVGAGPSLDVLSTIDYMELFQLYAQAPQYLAIVVEDSHYGLQPSFGRLSAASVLSQIPALGKGLRPFSGRQYYTALTGHSDENPSFVGEVFLDFNVLGVVVAFGAIGYATALLQQRVLSATHAFEVYVFQMMSVFLLASVLISIDVLAQFFIFNMFPFYVYFVLRSWQRPDNARAGTHDRQGNG